MNTSILTLVVSKTGGTSGTLVTMYLKDENSCARWERCHPDMAKSRQVKRTTQRNKADRLFSLYIRARDKCCVKCGRTQNLQCAHVFSRSYLKVRFDPRNAVALCAGCHKYLTHHGIEHEDFFRARMGDEAYEELRNDARGIGDKVDYEEVLAWLSTQT